MKKTKLQKSILLLSPLPPPTGGIASWTQKFIGWGQQNSLDIEIVNTAVIGGRANKINKKIKVFEELERTINIFKDIKNKIKKNKNYIGHLNTPCGNFGILRDYLCAIIFKKNNIPFVVHYRCNIEDQIKTNKFKKYVLKKLVRLADKNIVLNTPSKEYIKEFSLSKIEVIPNFIEEIFLLNQPRKINKSIEKVVFVGHVQETKGVREILAISDKFPNIEFVIIGPIADSIKSITAPKNVIFKGTLESKEIRNVLMSSDVFLFPTYTEGFSNALLEAMAVGLPVITTSVGANEDMIESEGGITVKVRSEKDLINALKNTSDYATRKEFSDWNIEKVKKSYLINNVMEKLFRVYESLEYKK